MTFMVNFLLRKIFRGNLNEAISLAKIEVTLKVMSVLTNNIALSNVETIQTY